MERSLCRETELKYVYRLGGSDLTICNPPAGTLGVVGSAGIYYLLRAYGEPTDIQMLCKTFCPINMPQLTGLASMGLGLLLAGPVTLLFVSANRNSQQ